MLLNCTDAVNT